LRILITGGCGFVGGHVTREAKGRGHDVCVADLGRDGVAPDVVLNVTNADDVSMAVQNQDVVVHCAAVVGPIPARKHPDLATRLNVGGTANLLEAARNHGTRVVYLSTATLYGHRPDLAPLCESDRPEPISHYDATKYSAEVLCQSYRKDFGVDVVSVRTGFVYGPGHSTGEYFVEAVLRGESVHQEAGADSPCDFTYVKDLARGLVLAAEHTNLPEPVYNVTGGDLRTRGAFVDIVRDLLPDSDISIGSGRQPSMHLRGPCAIDLAKRDLGYQPMYSLETGIADWVNTAKGEYQV